MVPGGSVAGGSTGPVAPGVGETAVADGAGMAADGVSSTVGGGVPQAESAARSAAVVIQKDKGRRDRGLVRSFVAAFFGSSGRLPW